METPFLWEDGGHVDQERTYSTSLPTRATRTGGQDGPRDHQGDGPAPWRGDLGGPAAGIDAKLRFLVGRAVRAYRRRTKRLERMPRERRRDLSGSGRPVPRLLESDGTAARSATSYAFSDSGVWAMPAARICASCRCSSAGLPSPRAVAMNRSSSAQHKLRPLVSPGNRPSQSARPAAHGLGWLTGTLDLAGVSRRPPPCPARLG
jgi:hypothetical protein